MEDNTTEIKPEATKTPQSLKRRSFRNYIIIFFFINFLLVLGNFLWTLVSNMQSLEDGRYVEISKENENFTQRLELLVNTIVNGSPELKEVLKNNIEQYDANLNALIKGGQITVANDVIEIDAANGKILSKLEEISRTWEDLKVQLNIILNQPIEFDTTVVTEIPLVIPDSLKNVPDSLTKDSTEIITTQEVSRKLRLSNPAIERAAVFSQGILEELLDKNQELNEMYAEQFVNSQANQRFVLLVTVSLNLVLLFLGMILIITQLINPLAKISLTAQYVAQGDVNAKVDYNQKNEIGAVADSLNFLVENFQQYASFANEIGDGRFKTDFEVNSEKDVLGYSLLSMRDSLRNVAEEDQKRNWANEGFSIFSNILRDTGRSSEDLAYAIISQLVKYLEANQGGLFLLEEEEVKTDKLTTKEPEKIDILKLKAAFAYNKRKYEQRNIALGQGLLGQAVMEKEITYIKNAPTDYVRITSGLGDAPPNIILIAPLIVNEEIYGAIELASFKHFADYELEFIRQIAESIASTLASVKASENTKRLLEESKDKEERMKEQEKEMVKNMEQLAATKMEMEKNTQQLEEYKQNLEKQVESRTAELKEKEIQLSNTLLQLEGIMESSTAGIVALTTEFRVVSVNKKMRSLVKKYYDVELKLGTVWMDIFSDRTQKKSSRSHWNRALAGEDFILEEELGKGRDKRWIETSFSPIQSNTGEVVGASMFQRDITDRKLSQKRIERTAKILDNSTNEVYLFDAEDYKFLEVNERGLKSLGYTLDELKEIPFYVLELEFNMQEFENFVTPLKDGSIENLLFETVYKRKDKTTYDVEVNLQLFKEDEGAVFAAIVQDITDRKKYEYKLQEALTRFDLVSSATNEGLWEMQFEEDIDINPIHPENPFWLSKQFKALLGFEDTELPNKLESWSSLLHPEDRERVLQNFKAHINDKAGQTPYNLEYRLLSKEGEYVWFASTGATLRDKQGNPLRVAGSIRNIARRKRAEQSLIEQTIQNETILNAAINSIIAIDMKGKIFSVNKATLSMFGYTEEEIIGKNIRIIMEEPDASKHNSYLRNYHETGKKKIIGIKREEIAVRKDGSTFPTEISVSEGVIGKRKFYIGIIRDITERKQSESFFIETQERVQKLADATSEGIFIHKEGIVENVNKALCDLTGYEKNEIVGKELTTIFVEESKKVILEKVAQQSEEPYEVEIRHKEGHPILVEINPKNIELAVGKARVASVRNLEGEKTKEVAMINSQKMLRRQVNALKEMGDFLTSNIPTEDFIKISLRLIAEALKVERVSLWDFQEKQIEAIQIYELSKNQYSQGLILKEDAFPSYFTAMKTKQMLVAIDARGDARTKEFTESYFIPNDIHSLLDIPIISQDKIMNIICLENTGEIRDWQIEEQAFLQSLPLLISIKLHFLREQ